MVHDFVSTSMMLSTRSRSRRLPPSSFCRAPLVRKRTFWTWLWGPIGLIFATPLTMCLVVLGRHVDQLKFLEVMFGDEPPLTPAELIYQRMLARDPVEAADQARIFLKDKPLTAYYDEILLEGSGSHKLTRSAVRSMKIRCAASAMRSLSLSTTLRRTLM